MKTLDKTMDHGDTIFMNLKQKFRLCKSYAKLKKRVYIGLEIWNLLLDDQFTEKFNFTGYARSLVYPL